jgi:hypothetical protein
MHVTYRNNTHLVLLISALQSVTPITLPTTAKSRPTLGSLPATAHLNSGEFTISLPMRRAMASDGAPETTTYKPQNKHKRSYNEKMHTKTPLSEVICAFTAFAS